MAQQRFYPAQPSGIGHPANYRYGDDEIARWPINSARDQSDRAARLKQRPQSSSAGMLVFMHSHVFC